MGRHWRRGRLNVYVGISNSYGVKFELDFFEGWGLIVQVFNAYFAIEWWASVGR